MGDAGGLIVFTNTSSSECSLTGYPTVVAKGPQGQILMTAKQTSSSMLGGINEVPAPQAQIRAGLAASAVIDGLFPNTHYPCSTVATLVITAPGTSESFSLPNSFPTGMGVPGCGPISVHPVLPGFHYSDGPTGLTSTGL